MGCHFLLQGNLPNPRIKPGSPALQADSLPTELVIPKLPSREFYQLLFPQTLYVCRRSGYNLVPSPLWQEKSVGWECPRLAQCCRFKACTGVSCLGPASQVSPSPLADPPGQVGFVPATQGTCVNKCFQCLLCVHAGERVDHIGPALLSLPFPGGDGRQRSRSCVRGERC